MSTTDRLYTRIKMMTARGIITATDDTQGVHYAQVRVTPRETIDKVPVVQIYGFGSHAKPTSETHLLFATGDRSKAVAIATNDPAARPRNLQPGEVSIYTDEGDIIVLKRGHQIAITTTGTVTVTAGTVNIAGPASGNVTVNVTGDIHATGTITANTIDAPNGHVGP
jgi:phage baseplate assembly protein V